MKKYIFKIVIILIFLFGFKNSKATCANGYSQIGYTILNINGCDYNVDICYKCGIVNPGDVHLMGFSKVDPNCVQTKTEAEVWTLIVDRVINPNFIFSVLCPITSIPPCDIYDGGVFFTVTVDRCWQKQWINGVLWTVPCDTGMNLCYYTIKWCFNYQTLSFERKITQGPEISTQYECPTGIPVNPPYGQTSVCFSLPTLCD